MRALPLKLVGIVVLLILMVVLAPFGTVPAGHRGVMTTFGSPSSEVLSEGIHFRIPLAQRLNLVNVSIQKGEGDGDAEHDGDRERHQQKTDDALLHH